MAGRTDDYLYTNASTMIPPNAFLNGERIFLRAPEPDDIPMITRLENHPDPRYSLFYAFPTSQLQQRDKTDRQMQDPNTILFTICRTDTLESIGQTALVRIDWVGRMGTFYLGIADKANWSGGFGTEATYLMTQYAFKTLNFNRVELKVAAENTAAYRVYEKNGFRHEGTLRQAMYHEGRYCDFHVMGLLKEEFYALKKI
jgi:RimJ/RimL family protein N-acetyltransferase